MGYVFDDKTGRKYNHLLVLERAPDYISPKVRHDTKWFCECDKCERITAIRSCHLVTNHAKACVYCRNEELPVNRNEKQRIERSSKCILGVTKRPNGKYRAQISFEDTMVSLGDFVSVVEAAKCYDKANYKRLGDKAVLNFPEDYLIECLN